MSHEQFGGGYAANVYEWWAGEDVTTMMGVANPYGVVFTPNTAVTNYGTT